MTLPEIPPVTPAALNSFLAALHEAGLPISMRQLLGYSDDQLAELLGWHDAIVEIRQAHGPLPLELLPAPPDFVTGPPVSSPQGDGDGR